MNALKVWIVVFWTVFTSSANAQVSPALDSEVKPAPVVSLTYGATPKSISLRRGTQIQFSGTKLSESSGSRIEVKANGEIVKTCRADEKWTVQLRTDNQLKDAVFVVFNLIEPGFKPAKMFSIVVNLFEKCPVSIASIKYNIDEPWTCRVKTTSSQEIDIDKISIMLDGKETGVSTTLGQSAFIALDKQIPGTHSLKLHINLANNGGEMFSEPTEFETKSVASIEIDRPEVNLRENFDKSSSTVSFKMQSAITAKFYDVYLDDVVYKRLDGQPSSIDIDALKLYAGDYDIWIAVTEESNHVVYSDKKPLSILRNGKKEYAFYQKTLLDAIDTFNARIAEISKQERAFDTKYAEMRRMTTYPEWNTAMAELVSMCGEITELYQGLGGEVSLKLSSVGVPYGVGKQFHPRLKRAINWAGTSESLRLQGWQRQRAWLNLIVWDLLAKKATLDEKKILPILFSSPQNGAFKLLERRDYEVAAVQSQNECIRILAEVGREIPG